MKNEESGENHQSADSIMDALLRHAQLKYIDVEGTRVVTNNRCVDRERKDQDEEKLRKSIFKGFARHTLENRAILATAEEEDQHIDDITGEELVMSKIRHDRAQELKYI